MTKIKNKLNKLVAMYARVSTASQEEQQTVQGQILAMEEFAKEKGYIITERYIDDGWSGTNLDRPELDRLRFEAGTEDWEAVLIYDPSRLSRKYAHQVLLVEEFNKKEIDVLYATIKPAENDEDKVIQGMLGLFAEYERSKITTRFRVGKKNKLKQGNILLSTAPYGYDYIPKKDNKHGYLKINNREAEIVKMIFSLVVEKGMTIRSLVKELQQLGIKPRRSKRGVWSTSTLSSLLRNTTYYGEYRWGTTEAIEPKKPLIEKKYRKIKKTSRRKRPKENWVTLEVPNIIPKELFDRVQIQLANNFKLCKRNKKNDYLLGSLIFCECGKRRTGEGLNEGRNLYYRCNDRVSRAPLPKQCFAGGLNARKTDILVWDSLVELMTDKELLESQIKRFMNERNAIKTGVNDDIEFLKKRLQDLLSEEKRYHRAYGANAIELEQLQEYTEPIKLQIEHIKGKINTIEKQNKSVTIESIPSEDKIKIFVEKTLNTLKELSFEKKREIVLSAISRVEGTKEKLLVMGAIPIKSNYEFKTIYRYSRAS